MADDPEVFEDQPPEDQPPPGDNPPPQDPNDPGDEPVPPLELCPDDSDDDSDDDDDEPAAGSGMSEDERRTVQAMAAMVAAAMPKTKVYKPKAPKMGGVVSIGSTEKVAWTGGKPKADWSGLETPNSSPTSPNQYRSHHVSSAQKSKAYRIAGLSTKFDKKGDLATFEKNVMKHLKDYGLDTVTYLQDPEDSTSVTSCVEGHPRYSKSSVARLVAPQLAKYDSYDSSNDRDATEFLKNSLEASLAVQLDLETEESDCFPKVWIALVVILQSTSIERFKQLEKQLEELKSSQFAGQDLSQLLSKFKTTAQELDVAGQYDHKLTLTLVNACLEAGGDGENGQQFKHALRTMKENLSEALVEIAYKSKTDAKRHLASKKLTCSQVIGKILDRYRLFKNNSQWDPIKHATDSKAAPRAFGNLVLDPSATCQTVGVPLTQAQFNALFQQTAAPRKKTPENSPCNNCGKLGHWARDCPNKSSEGAGNNQGDSNPGHNCGGQGRRGRNRSGGNGSQGGNGGNGNGGVARNWKKVAPRPGQPESKVAQGKTWHWCAKCRRWSTTHGTAKHGQKDEPSPAPTPQANTLFLDPGAWHAEFDFELGLKDVLLGLFQIVLTLIHPFASPLLYATLGYWHSQLPANWWIAGVDAVIWCVTVVASHVSSHWRLYPLPAIWFLLLLAAVFLPSKFERDARAEVLRAPPPTPPPRWATRQGTKFSKHHERWGRRRLQELQPRYGRRRTPPRHPSLVQRARGAPDIKQRQRNQLYDLSEEVKAFERSLTFTHARPLLGREGEAGRPKGARRSKSTTLKRGPDIRHRGRRNLNTPTYRPVGSNAAHGLTRSQLDAICSPAARAYLANADVPSPLLSVASALKAAFTSPKETKEVVKEHTFPVIWDSGASASVSPCKEDFVGPLEKPPIAVRLQGIAKGLHVAGIGHVAWSFVDVTGVLRTLKVPAYYVPKSKARLLSTTSLLQTYPDESIELLSDRTILSGSKNREQGHRRGVEVLIEPSTNLPVGWAYANQASQQICEEFHLTLSTIMEHNHNISPAEKELLRWHFRLGHLSFRKVQFLMRTGVLSHSEGTRRLHERACRIDHPPLCAACQYGKQKRRPSPGKTSRVVKDRAGALKKDQLFPGQRASVDHFVCSTRGRLKHTFGKESIKHQYSGGAIFVDHASGYINVQHQTHLNTHETLTAKNAFEEHCRDYGVIPQEYLSDNGKAFTSANFRVHLESFAQVSKYAGVGAHHHNGVCERAIHTVMSIARTMMLHVAIHWPDVADATLWPLAVDHAVMLYNAMPDPSTGLSPQDVFTQMRNPHSRFQDCHVWGCPVYVLDKTLADGKKLPKWKPRASRHVYVGRSPEHASSVPLVLSLETGAITPQFHVVFDDWFATVPADASSLPAIGSPEWTSLFGDSVCQYTMDDEEQADVDIRQECPEYERRSKEIRETVTCRSPPKPLQVPPPAAQAPASSPEAPLSPVVEPPVPEVESMPPLESPAEPVASDSPQRERVPAAKSNAPPSPQREPPTPRSLSSDLGQERESPPVAPPSAQRPSPTPVRRSTRTRAAPQRFGHDGSQGHGHLSHFIDFHYAHKFDHGCNTSMTAPTVCKASARKVKDPDTLSWDEAMHSSDRDKWLKAAEIEIAALVHQGTWVEAPVSDAQTKILPGTWAFRRKRSPSGEIKKHKARCCCRGDLQEGSLFDTCAPVVAWSAVRAFLVLSLILGWHTASADFQSAFVQAVLPAEEPVWIHLPRGFSSTKGPKTCLRLVKSLYGLSSAPKLWCKHCLQAFLDLGFIQSEYDQCLLLRHDCVVCLYVDDCGISAVQESTIDQLTFQLREKGFELMKEGSFTEFLGVKFERRDDGAIKLTQKGLIDKILSATGLVDSKPNLLPAASQALGTDADGDPMKEDWSHPSVIGMLLHLSANTRPDISLAVSQVARFNSNPKQSHATAVKTLVRYLKRTRDQGMPLSPTGRLDLDLWVDADFAGLCRCEADSDPNSVRSRTGYIITLSGCPLVWKSQLQSAISCSTLEAEYQAASYALRTLLPLKNLLLEIVFTLDISQDLRTSVRARMFEDNQGACYLAANHRITNRAKYFLVKWHWFWSHCDEFDTIKVESAEQLADYLTKPLTRELFENNRLKVQGWWHFGSIASFVCHMLWLGQDVGALL